MKDQFVVVYCALVVSIILWNADTVASYAYGSNPGLTLKDMKQIKIDKVKRSKVVLKSEQCYAMDGSLKSLPTDTDGQSLWTVWWIMDLEKNTYVNHVTIHLHDDYAGKLKNTSVFIMTENPAEMGKKPDPTKSALCGKVSGNHSTTIANVTCQSSHGLPFGSKVYVLFGERDTNYEILAVCEVQVFGAIPLCRREPSICPKGSKCFPENQIDPFLSVSCDCYGFKGENCEKSIDECMSNPCKNGATCDDLVAKYNCTCPPGYTDENCATDINECSSDPCQNGTCKNLINKYNCSCDPGYTGLNCETDIDECKSSPCQKDGTCENHIDSYKCKCPYGMIGKKCETDENECSSDPCENDATCTDQVGSYKCTCKGGYSGQKCAVDMNITSCDSDNPPKPCRDGNCTNIISNGNQPDYNCLCEAGFSGKICEIDVDECNSQPCNNSGRCHDKINDFSCSCEPGYIGATCDTEIDECNSQPCKNSGTCRDKINAFSCSCEPGYNGTTCETDIDECQSQPCNDGQCIDKVNDYSCNCKKGFVGTNCETLLDACGSNPCTRNRGRCESDDNGYKCICYAGFTGLSCGEVCAEGATGFSCAEKRDEDEDTPSWRMIILGSLLAFFGIVLIVGVIIIKGVICMCEICKTPKKNKDEEVIDLTKTVGEEIQ